MGTYLKSICAWTMPIMYNSWRSATCGSPKQSSLLQVKGWEPEWSNPTELNVPSKLGNTLNMCFRSCSKFKISTFLGICSYGLHIIYFIFVQFMQFPVLHFGLAHSGSWPFNLNNCDILVQCGHKKFEFCVCQKKVQIGPKHRR